jgi:hypothetical protein
MQTQSIEIYRSEILSVSLFLVGVFIACSGWCLGSEDLKGAKVKYISTSQAKTFPVPAIAFRRPGLATVDRRTEVLSKIVLPIIRETSYPISAVVVEFFGDHLNEYVGIDVVSSVHPMNSGLIYFEKDGKITDELYKQWFAHENDEGEDRD